MHGRRRSKEQSLSPTRRSTRCQHVLRRPRPLRSYVRGSVSRITPVACSIDVSTHHMSHSCGPMVGEACRLGPEALLNGPAPRREVQAERPGDLSRHSALIETRAPATSACPWPLLERCSAPIGSCSSVQTPRGYSSEFSSMAAAARRPTGQHADRVLVPHETAHHTQGGSRQ